MSAELIKKENNVVDLQIVVSKEEFTKAINGAYNKLKGRFNVPGFRKGKAPKKLIEMNYGKGVFVEEAINMVFPVAYRKAIEELNLSPIEMPNITDVKNAEEGKDLEMTVQVTVKPEFKLGEYKGVEAEKITVEVSEDLVEKEIEAKRESNARFVKVEDRAVKNQDMTVIDFEGFVDGVAFEGGKSDNYNLVIGSNTFIPGFEEQLIGAEIGKEVEVNVEFPESYHADNLAGKPAVFKVTVKEIKEKELPNLDDEFVKDISEFDTLDELKADVRAKLEEDAKKTSESETRKAVVEKVLENTEVEIPAAMVKAETEAMLKDFDMQLRYQGLNLEQYMSLIGKQKQDLEEEMKEDAKNTVKRSLVLEKISEVEKIEVSNEEFEDYIKEMAESYKMELDKFKQNLNEEYEENIKHSLVVKKTVDMLVENAKLA